MNVQSAIQLAQANPEAAQAANAQFQAILSRSATDADFRRRLLAEPKETLSEVLGQHVPYDIRFVENHADATIVLPAVVAESTELSDSELEAVAGGSEPVAIFLGCVAAGMILGGVIAKAASD